MILLCKILRGARESATALLPIDPKRELRYRKPVEKNVTRW